MMNWLSEFTRRLRFLFRRRQFDREMEEEMSFHLDLKAQEVGESAARRRFGNLTLLREASREAWGWAWWETGVQDARFAARMLRRSPGFTAVAVLSLALGIGANTAIFSLVNAVVLRPLPYRDPERLVAVSRGEEPVLPAQFLEWKARSQAVEHLTATYVTSFQLTGADAAEELRGCRASAGLSGLLGTAPALGRDFQPDEPVVVLSHRLWQRRFGGDPSVPGRVLTLDGVPLTVAGVMPAGLDFPSEQVDLWAPFPPSQETVGGLRRTYTVQVYGRLKSGVTLDQARAEMGPGSYVVPLHERLVAPVKPALLVLLAAVGFVLLIACANLANLLLERAAARQKEIAIRTALGASRGRLIRQLVTESLLLSGLGGLAGLLLAFSRLNLLVGFLGDVTSTPRLQQTTIDYRVMAFASVLAVLTGVLSGLLPAVRISGPAGFLRPVGVSRLVVVSEMALALILLTGAGLMLRTLHRIRQIDLGFNPQGVLVARIPPLRAGSVPAPQRLAFLQQLLERVQRLPQVQSAGVVSTLPHGDSVATMGFWIEGRPAPPPEQRPVARFSAVSPDYFRTMGIRLLRGRSFTPRDAPGALPAVIINETMAQRYWPGEDPVGRRLLRGRPGAPPLLIVGVVRDVRLQLLEAERGPFVYFPYLQEERTMLLPGYLVVRTAGDPLPLATTVRSEIWALDRAQLIPEVAGMEQLLARSISQRHLLMILLGGFAAIALALSAVGIYGAVSYSVSRRTQEIGIRMALGAQPREVHAMVLGEGMRLAGIGIVLGAAGALAVTRFLSAHLYGVTATDPVSFVGVGLLEAAVAALACYLPARRAMRVDPVLALRSE